MRISAALLVAVFVPAMFAGVLSAEEPAAGPSVAAVARWIAELDSDSFQARETATKQLVAAGVPAVPKLATAAEGDNLEVTIRALRILHNIFKTDDGATFVTVENVLERLAASKNRSVARRAAYVLAAHGEDRHQRAIAALKKLDAIIEEPSSQTPGLRIYLDSKWQGGDEGLRHLKRLKALTMLPQRSSPPHALYIVDGCPASKDALNELDRSRSDLDVLERGDAFLGVASDSRYPGCYITKVTPGSSADGKLEGRDVVTSYNGQEVANFDAMVAMIRKNKGGDTVKLTVIRKNTKIEVELTLKSWRSVLVKKMAGKKTIGAPTAPPPPVPKSPQP